MMFACNSGKDENFATDSSDGEVISETDSLLNTESAITEFKLITAQPEPSKDKIQAVEEWTENNVIRSTFTPSQRFYSDYASVIRFSPDSSKILDFGSYGNMVTKNEKGQTLLEGGDPDSEVSIIDLKTNTKTRLFYTGPSGIIKSGTWLNNRTVMFSGYFDENNSGKTDTLFWMVNVDSMHFQKFRYKQ